MLGTYLEHMGNIILVETVCIHPLCLLLGGPCQLVSGLVHPSYKWTLALFSLLITGATSNLLSGVSHQVGWYGRFMINIGTHVCLISTLIHHQFQDTMWGYYSIGKFNENYVGFKRHVSDAGHGSPIANR